MSRGTNCELFKNKSRIISFRIAKFQWMEEEVELLEVTVLPSCLGRVVTSVSNTTNIS